MAEQFVKLTQDDGNPMWTNGTIAIYAVGPGTRIDYPGRPFYVRESPSEVLALLAPSAAPVRSNLKGVEDVVQKLIVMVNRFDKDALANDYIEWPVTRADMRRLVAAIVATMPKEPTDA